MTQAQSDISVSIKALHQLPIDSQLALLFPGQGAQKLGMGFEASQSSPSAKAVFQTADEVLRTKLSRLCFEGPEEELTRTVNARPRPVIGGAPEVVGTACRLAKERGGRGLPMKVAGAFHTSLMGSAARNFESVLQRVNAQEPAIPVVGNVAAKPIASAADL